MKLWFRNFRISILNWLAAGRITIQKDKPQEYNLMSTYLNPGTLTINPNGVSGGYSSTPINSNGTITVKITPANGGTIVQVSQSDYSNGDLHIIPDGADFDRELGKIITLNKLKA